MSTSSADVIAPGAHRSGHRPDATVEGRRLRERLLTQNRETLADLPDDLGELGALVGE